MSISSGESQFFSEFLDDFFAESEEHLALARRILLSLEESPHDPDLAQIDELFRAFHSLKGLAGMVGVGEIEQLAHELEALLRALRKGDVELGDDVLDALIGGVRLLEQCLAARKTGTAAPPVEAAARTLAELTEGRRVSLPAPAAQGGEEAAKIAAAVGQGMRVWRVVFTPSAALAERGVHVNSVRERLLALGELLRAAPQVSPGGVLTFDFVLASAAPERAFEGWDADGLDVAPYAPPAAPSPPPASAAYSPTPASPIVSGTVVRVDLDRLDDLMRMVGELVISNARLEEQIAQAAPLLPTAAARALHDLVGSFQRQTRSLRAGVMRTRLVPIGESFGRIQFMARDLARDLGRQVAVVLRGEHTEIDKFLVDRLMDPLMHLVRNALSHGLEPPQERAAQGKPSAGRLALSAAADGEHVVVTVADDGRGIDIGRVAARARAHGLLAEGEELAPDRLLDILCAPGFSTRDQADRVSGRGVGMDVVANAVHELRGSLALATAAGQGTTFTLRLPLTLAIMDALLVVVADQRFAIPISAIREIISLEPGQITPLERNELITHRGAPLPLVRIAQRFQIAGAARYGHACVVGEGGGAAALVFDRPLGKREIVVRPLTDPLVAQPYLAGATELGDGRVVLLLDVAALLRPASAARENRP